MCYMYHFFRVIQYFIGYVSGEDIKTHLDIHSFIHLFSLLPFSSLTRPTDPNPGQSSNNQTHCQPITVFLIKHTCGVMTSFFNNLWWFSVLPVMSPEPPKRHGATNEIYAYPPLSVSWLSVAFILVLPSPSLFHRIMHFGVLFNPLKLLMSHSKVTHFQYSHQNECVPPPYFYTTRNIMETYRSPASCPTKP